MLAIFDFGSLLTVLLLLICTCAYIREMRPSIFDPAPSTVVSMMALLVQVCRGDDNDMQDIIPISRMFVFCFFPLKRQKAQQNGQPPPEQQRPQREGISGFLWKLSRIGERLSPYVGAGCIVMALHILFFK